MTKKIKNKNAISKLIDKRINKIIDARITAIIDPKVTNLVKSIDTSDSLTRTLENHVDELESEFRHEVHLLQENVPEEYELQELKSVVDDIQYFVDNDSMNEDNVTELIDQRIREELDGHDIESLVQAVSNVSTIRDALEALGDSVKYL